MKKKHIIYSLTVLTILAATAGTTSMVMAAGNETALGHIMGKFRSQKIEDRQPLTDQQKTDIKTKTDAIKTALNAGDYNAWVTAVKALDVNSPVLKKVTATNFGTYTTQAKQKETDLAAQKVKMDAVKTAVNNGDYNAWVIAVKAVEANAPILEKINANNFSQYADAFKKIEQAHATMTDLGITVRSMGGFGLGMGGGFGDGEHMGMGMMGKNKVPQSNI